MSDPLTPKERADMVRVVDSLYALPRERRLAVVAMLVAARPDCPFVEGLVQNILSVDAPRKETIV